MGTQPSWHQPPRGQVDDAIRPFLKDRQALHIHAACGCVCHQYLEEGAQVPVVDDVPKTLQDDLQVPERVKAVQRRDRVDYAEHARARREPVQQLVQRVAHGSYVVGPQRFHHVPVVEEVEIQVIAADELQEDLDYQ